MLIMQSDYDVDRQSDTVWDRSAGCFRRYQANSVTARPVRRPSGRLPVITQHVNKLVKYSEILLTNS